MNQIEVIKEKLAMLRQLDRGFSIFGSSRHRYELNDTFSANEINRLESDNKISLSQEYKDLLMHLGNGGAGCGYGLERLDLNHINPPYKGTSQLLRNWDDPSKIDEDMVDLDEISGYIKLFDYGCGMEYCLIVNGEETGALIFFDCDGRFRKLEDVSLLEMYEKWLDNSLEVLQRIQEKLTELPLQEVLDSEWDLKNFSVKDMVLSIIGGRPLSGGYSGNQMKVHLEKEYQKWKHELAN